MIKYKTTAKEIRENYLKNDIITVGYCDAQYLLINKSPCAYSCGVYGWNFDLYEIDGLAICTGYRATPSGNEKAREIVAKYEKQATKIYHNYTQDYDALIKKIDKLLNKCIKEIKGGEND